MALGKKTFIRNESEIKLKSMTDHLNQDEHQSYRPIYSRTSASNKWLKNAKKHLLALSF